MTIDRRTDEACCAESGSGPCPVHEPNATRRWKQAVAGHDAPYGAQIERWIAHWAEGGDPIRLRYTWTAGINLPDPFAHGPDAWLVEQQEPTGLWRYYSVHVPDTALRHPSQFGYATESEALRAAIKANQARWGQLLTEAEAIQARITGYEARLREIGEAADAVG